MTEGSWVDQQREGLNNDEGESVKKRRPKPSNWEGLNIFKQGKAPVEKPDDEYPEWIWDLARPQRTRTELMKEAELAFRQGGEYPKTRESQRVARNIYLASCRPQMPGKVDLKSEYKNFSPNRASQVRKK